MITTMRQSHIYICVYICLCKCIFCLIITFMGKLLVCISSLSNYTYKCSQYLLLRRIIHLCRLFSSALSNDVVQLLMYCHTIFLIHSDDCAFHNSLGSTFLECSRIIFFVCLFKISVQPCLCLWGEEMSSKFPLSYFICKYVFNAADLGIHKN